MANYNVDILLKVGGTTALKQLNDKLKETEKLQKKIEQLSAGAASGNYLRRKLEAEKQAVAVQEKQVKAQKELVRLEQDFINKTSISNRIARQKSAEKIKELRLERQIQNERLKGLGQYGSPIGPSASGAAEFRKFNQRMAQERAMQAYMGAGAPGAPVSGRPFGGGQKALPAFQQRGLKLLDDSVKLNQRNLEIETRLNGQRARGVRFLEKQTQEEKRQLDLGLGGRQRTNLLGRSQVVGGGAGRFDMASQYGQPIGPQRPRKGGRGGRGGRGGGFGGGFQSAALGVGFPLLFGGGAGSVIGGGLGSPFGFGGQIIGSAIGQQVDQIVGGITRLGKALNTFTPDVDALVNSAGLAATETGNLILSIEKLEGASVAQALAAEQLAVVIGQDGVAALDDAGAAMAELGNEASKLFTALAAALAPSLSAVAQFLTTNITESRQLSRTDPGTFGVGGGDLANNERVLQIRSYLNKGIITETTARKRLLEIVQEIEAADQRAADASAENVVKNGQSAAIMESQIDLLQIGGDLQDRANYLKQIEIEGLKLEQKLQDETLSKLERKLAVEESRIAMKQLADARDKGALAEAEEFERKLQQDLKKRRQLQANLLAEDNKRQEIENKITEATEGRAAAIQRELADMQAAYTADAQRIILTTESKDLAQEKVNTLAKEYELKQLLLRQEYTELQLQKDLLAIKQEQTLAGISTSLNRQIEDANLRSTGNSMEDEQLELRISQIRRQEDARRALTEQIERQEAAILRYSKSGNATGVTKAQEEIVFLQRQIALHDQLLPQLDAAEQAQLRFNQALQAAQPFADAFTSSLFNGLMGVIDGTQTAQEAFAGFLNSIADMLMQTAQQMIAQYLALAVARTFAMGGGPVSSGIDTSSMSGGFNPLSFVLGPFSGFGKALGGSVSGNQPYLVGERGPELFVPGAQGNIVPNNAMGGVNVGTINISVENTGEQLSPQAQKQLAGQVKGIVLGTLANERRSGGML